MKCAQAFPGPLPFLKKGKGLGERLVQYMYVQLEITRTMNGVNV